MISFVLPPALAPLLEVYTSQVWPTLRAGLGVGTLFLSKAGAPLAPPSFCNYWTRLMQQEGTRACFPPQRLRHIFASDRLQHEGPGPSHEHAAIVMGNSVPAWKAHYFTLFQNFGAQAAVDRMTEYREACVARLRERAPAVQALLAREGVGTHAAQLFQVEEPLEEGSVLEQEEEELGRVAQAAAEAAMEEVDALSADYSEEEEGEEELEIDLGSDSDFD